MGSVRFSCPPDLVKALAASGGIDAAVETGTFKAEGTLALRQAVSRVWTVELSHELHARAVARHGRDRGITFLHGSSDEVLPKLATEITEPVIFWLDAHGGMVDLLSNEQFDPAGEATQCPVVLELQAVGMFPEAQKSCILIDDARAFLGPLPRHRAADWPSIVELFHILRTDFDRYITILDDMVIAVPAELRDVVDRWWLEQLEKREGRGGEDQKYWEACNPTPIVAARRLVKSLAPAALRRIYYRRK